MYTTDPKSDCCRQRSRFGKWLLERRLRKLKLDDHQRVQLGQLLDRARNAHLNRVHADGALREYIGSVIADSDFDHERAAARIRSAAERHAADTTAAAAAFGEFCRKLEPWQQQQLQKLWRRRRRCASRCCR